MKKVKGMNSIKNDKEKNTLKNDNNLKVIQDYIKSKKVN